MSALTDAIGENLVRRAGAPFLAWQGRLFTYGELRERVAVYGLAAEQAGLSAQSLVAIVDLNPPDQIAAFVAGLLGHYTPALLSGERSMEANRRLLSALRPDGLIAGPSAVDQLLAASGSLLIEPLESAPGWRLPQVDRSVSHVTLSSGSMGLPKLIAVDADGLADFGRAAAAELHLTGSDVWCEVGDGTSDIAVNNLLLALSQGSLTVRLTATERLRPLSSMRRHQVTHLRVVPPVADMLHLEAQRRPGAIATLRLAAFGGDRLTSSHVSRMRGVVDPQCLIINTYGLAETAGYVLSSRIGTDIPGDEQGLLPVGLPTHGVTAQMRIAAEEPLGRGELIVATSQVALSVRRLLQDECLTVHAKPLPGMSAPFATGDLVEEREGQFWFHGRRDRTVTISGHQVSFDEIEGYIRSLGVETVHVGVHGQGIRVLMEGGGPVGETLERVIANMLPRYLTLQGVRVLAELPRTPTGKLDRLVCDQLWRDEEYD